MQHSIQFNTATLKLIKPVNDLWPTIIAQYQYFQYYLPIITKDTIN